MRKWLAIGTGLLIALIGTFVVMHKVSPIGWGLWSDTNNASGVAIEGYDPVAYFNTSKPTPGDSRFSTGWRGVEWHFASAENRDLFVGSPKTYAPQYGGYCAFAVSKGFTADASPDAWHIDNGKLYLFADGSVREDWVADLGPDQLSKSAANWAKR